MDKQTIRSIRDKVGERREQLREQLFQRYNHDTEIRYSECNSFYAMLTGLLNS